MSILQNINLVRFNLVTLLPRLLNRNPKLPFQMQTLQPAALGDNQVTAMKKPECQVVPLQKTTSREVGELEATKSPRDVAGRTSHISLPSPESFAHFSPE